MSDIIHAMRTEHMNLLRLLHLLEQQMQSFSRGDTADFELIGELLDYLGNYFERLHHPKEEAMMDRLGERVPELATQLAQMKDEHEHLAGLLHRFTATMDDIVMGSDLMSRDGVTTMAEELVNLNREHIKHEEQLVFPRALASLRERDWQEIESVAPEARDPLFGNEVQEQYQNLFRNLLNQPHP